MNASHCGAAGVLRRPAEEVRKRKALEAERRNLALWIATVSPLAGVRIAVPWPSLRSQILAEFPRRAATLAR